MSTENEGLLEVRDLNPACLRLTATRIVFPNKLDGLEYLCGKSIEIEPPYNTQLIKYQL